MIYNEYPKSSCLIILCFLMVFTFSCTQTEKYQGRYVASHSNAFGDEAISIELRDNGHGNWIIGEEDVEIRWEIRNGKLLLHTRAGGVLIGNLNADKMEIQQPDGQSLTLNKVH